MRTQSVYFDNSARSSSICAGSDLGSLDQRILAVAKRRVGHTISFCAGRQAATAAAPPARRATTTTTPIASAVTANSASADAIAYRRASGHTARINLDCASCQAVASRALAAPPCALDKRTELGCCLRAPEAAPRMAARMLPWSVRSSGNSQNNQLPQFGSKTAANESELKSHSMPHRSLKLDRPASLAVAVCCRCGLCDAVTAPAARPGGNQRQAGGQEHAAPRRRAKEAQKPDEYAEAQRAITRRRPAIRNASGSAAAWSACYGATTSTPRSATSISMTGSAARGGHVQARVPLPDPARRPASIRRRPDSLNGRVAGVLAQPDPAGRRRRRPARRPRLRPARPPPANRFTLDRPVRGRAVGVSELFQAAICCLEFATPGRYFLACRSQGSLTLLTTIVEPWGQVRARVLFAPRG